jgi:Fe-S-cluster-containing dehydrogenase component
MLGLPYCAGEEKMKLSRRAFLKATGCSLLGFSGNLLADFVLATQPPAGGESKWCMVVDLARPGEKEDCRDCIDACHRVHNVPSISDQKEEIKWIWTSPYSEVFPDQQREYLSQEVSRRPVLVLCNHCSNPPCVSVCPTKATFKGKEGIVMMDYHRCIGCRYCMAACPYGARSFNWKDPRPAIKRLDPSYPTRTKGVVEKCNFCEERLRKGLKPACVEACKDRRLIFGNLADPASEPRKAMEGRVALRRKPGLGTNPNVYYLV